MEEYNESVRNDILKNRFEIWKTFLRDLEKSAENDHTVVRFPNSSTYIFSTGAETFWMMDPAFSGSETSLSELEQIAESIRQKIAFIIITHLHGDHCQFELVKMLKTSSIQWVVPKDCAESFKEKSGISDEKILTPGDGECVELSGIRITAYPGYHYDPDKPVQTPSAAYEIILPDGIVLFFPADVRNYHAPLPKLKNVDYTFGHVFLGREDATGENFSLLEEFCQFMFRTGSRHLILAHLYEIGRLPRDLWTCRHAGMIGKRMKQLAPDLDVIVPGFGDAVHLVKDRSGFRDPLPQWSISDRECFFSFLGIALKYAHAEWMERAADEAVPVVEWLADAALDIDPDKRMEQLLRWREKGGRCLSIHFPDFPLSGSRESWDNAVELAIGSAADRITVHVPGISLKDMEQCFEKTVSRIIELCRPLLEKNIHIGIENLHMKPSYTADESRPFGFIPSECVQLVKRLREKSASELWGIHLDIGHAYSNPPYHDCCDTAVWLRECADLLNGMHIHQFEHQRSAETPFLRGHGNITGRNTGHPSLLPIFEAWAGKGIRVPLILEIMRGIEPDPFASLSRLKRNCTTVVQQ